MTALSDLETDAAIVVEHVARREQPVDGETVARLRAEFPRLHRLFCALYGEGSTSLESLLTLIDAVLDARADRPAALRRLDRDRVARPTWFESEKMLGGVCYVDRFAGDLDGVRGMIPYFRELGLTYLHLMPLFDRPEGENDGGYAVSDYRTVDPALGTMADLRALASELREAGISLVLDFIFNHTSNEHEWAKRALAGDPVYENFYLIFPDRELPDAYERTTREIFPDDHPGAFVPLPDGRWIWATFYRFQWDLNYANPDVFTAMAGEMLFLANQGVEILRMDAVAFIWKRLGTACESLPEAHLLLQAFNAVLRIAAPAVLFKSEAIVHPDEVQDYISPDECQLSYNPLQMALTWEALATRDARLLQLALDERHALPPGTAWVNYVRSHDDIGWTFADEDAARFGIDAGPHRRFLNEFYIGRFDGSFSRGYPFQENPRTGDARIAGTTASLAGIAAGDDGGEDRVVLAHALAMSTGGIPLLYLGDEVAQLNDDTFQGDPARRGDSRWAHRPERPRERYEERRDGSTVPGRVFTRLRRLIDVRRETPEFAGNELVPFHTSLAAVVGFTRPAADDAGGAVLVLANVGDEPATIPSETLSGLEESASDLVRDCMVGLGSGLVLPAHASVWLRVRRR
ncbi:alpha-amylase family protein [Microbacterium arborescens]|uniref:alpha-amylase family protein n=1 Tax=Microbacterium arborescens TaxID=33883 RepID=UPI00278082AE|nr:alpha-amylase family protein [Microbacterium arborescens]MDQ1216131.1 amylosucrase [Microbacterium arborescens]